MVNLLVQTFEILLCCLHIHIFAHSKTHEIEYLANDKGWRPMWREQVYNGSPDYSETTKQMRNADYDPKQADDIENIGSEVIKLVKPYQAIGGFSKANNVKGVYVDISRNVQRSIQDSDEIRKENNRYDIVMKETLLNPMENKIRKAKTISHLNSKENVIKEFEYARGKDLVKKNYEEENRATKSASDINTATYEVSENPEELEGNFKTSQTSVQNTGYSYEPPSKNQFTKENFNLNTTFINLLTKYTINNTDPNNYALSRSKHLRHYFKPEFILVPVPLTALDHRNSPNHLPVNPLLAVYLSNYGYYLPGSYGPRNQFRNLYGYLAFNNIHNNGPFGPYKVFSDTDSSNK